LALTGVANTARGFLSGLPYGPLLPLWTFFCFLAFLIAILLFSPMWKQRNWSN
jgi:hypothetical protein